MKDSDSGFKFVEQCLVMHAVVRSNEVCTAESELRRTAAWDEHGGVVDGNRNYLLALKEKVFVP